MRRKSDAIARWFLQVKTSGAASLETTLQLLLVVKYFHNPQSKGEEEHKKGGRDSIDPVTVFFLRFVFDPLVGCGRFDHDFPEVFSLSAALSVVMLPQGLAAVLFGSKKARIFELRLLGLRHPLLDLRCSSDETRRQACTDSPLFSGRCAFWPGRMCRDRAGALGRHALFA
jgi:hypothetical protein